MPTAGTRATIIERLGSVTLRIRFPEYVINISEGENGFKITSSSPKFLAMVKTNEGRAVNAALSRIKTETQPNETVRQKLERFQTLATASETLVVFVRAAKLME